MRNLRNTHRSVIEGENLSACAWDVSDQGSAICACGPTKESQVIQLKRWYRYERRWASIASWDALCPLPNLEHDFVLDLHYFPDTATIVLVFAGGDIVTVREEPADGQDRIEIVGSVDVGISAAAWSPDEELLVITTNASTLLYMTRDFDNIVDLALTDEDFSVSNHVSVGWGKKETQFKGKKARALRDPTVPENVDEGTLHPSDDSKVSISWRGDGAFVAINSVQRGRRVIRVLSREGSLDSVSEPVDCMTDALSWRPAGNLIAGVQCLDADVKVIFFERNGLRHGDFSLRLTKEEMLSRSTKIKLSWNNDSSVLAVCYEDQIQLWTMGNYHWYLKQSIACGPVVDFAWHPEKPLHFLSCNKTLVQSFTYALVVSGGPTAPPHDDGLVAVIDGRDVKLTPLKRSNIPPPMSLEILQLPHNINDVAVLRPGSSSAPRIAVLHEDTISVFRWPVASKPTIDREWAITQHSSQPGSQSSLRINVQQDGDVSAHSISLESDVTEDFVVKTTQRGIDFHLDERGFLWAGTRRLATGCTSFLVTPDHLLFTNKNLLKFVHLIGEPEQLEVPPDTPETDERCRSVERGARLVTVMPSVFAVVLQMPRGNLETIYPRALVLAGIRDSINQKKYRKAFLACRNHRVDMNILYDHAPQQFLDNVGLFVDRVKKPEYIDLFLSQLRNEDVTQRMYRETLRPLNDSAELNISFPIETKVGRICDAFIDVLKDRSPENLQNILAAFVCKTPPDLDAALLEIARLRNEKSAHVDTMIEQICFLADVNRLYEHALGLYDLEMTLLIAQRSQQDPKEYLPYLRNLQQMSELRRRFSIDDHLKRYTKAIYHLCELDAFDEVKSYAIKHALYQEVMAYYRYKGDKLQDTIRLYADYLSQKGQFQEAGVAYESLQDHNAASDSFRQAHLWQESLSNAVTAGVTGQQLNELAVTLSDMLVETKDFVSAARINLEYLSNTPAAARLFCKGYHFAEAMRIVGLYQRLDLLESVIDPCLREGMGTMTDLLADCKSQLNAQLPRIMELRIKKVEDPLAFWEGDAPSGDVPDDVSIAPTDASTTGGSLFTRYTNRTGTVGTNATRRTSKNKRREERKRARGKKGSVYEEEYLVNSVERLVQRVNSVNGEISRLVVGLARRGMREQARNVEAALSELIELCKKGVRDVFVIKPEEAWPDAEQVPPEPRIGPVVKGFEKVSLLGG